MKKLRSFIAEAYDVIHNHTCITLFKSITMLCGIDNILWNILHIQIECGKYFAEYCQSHRRLLCIDLYNVMHMWNCENGPIIQITSWYKFGSTTNHFMGRLRALPHLTNWFGNRERRHVWKWDSATLANWNAAWACSHCQLTSNNGVG